MEVEPRAGDAQLERLRRLAWWLDSSIPIPGTRFRIGLDPIIGLIPGVGDAVGTILSGWILLEAAGRGLPRAALVRMVVNIGIDALGGAIPVVGDLFDASWKSNLRNVAIMEQYQVDPARARRGDRLFLLLLGVILVVICGAITVGGVMLAARLVDIL